MSIRIDIVSDVVCPWCIVGYRKLQRALEQLGDAAPEVTVRWHPFELNPHMPPEGQDLREHLREKYGTSVEQSRGVRQRLTAIGAELGFAFDFNDEMRIYNTFRAHQLLAWADEQGQTTALELALFETYFKRQQNLYDIGVLGETAARAGLDGAQAERVLHDQIYSDAVRTHEREWLHKGVHAVPTFVLDDRYLIPGAQDPEVFIDAFGRVSRDNVA
ncbi:MAG: DsbA family oxidoreductase [Myxococcales bacterium]|nr:DsbA family oxidoreductase [Myxococcales bacterium]